MKSTDRVRTLVIRGVLAEITRLEKELRHDASEVEILQVIKRERQRREEALEFARNAGRADLVRHNQQEAEILNAYLPAAVSADELNEEIRKQIAAGAGQIGPIMKALKERFGARLDGKIASQLVRQALANR